MGASGWSYVTPYIDDPQDLLDRLHEEELAAGTYWWADDDVARPSTIEGLWEIFTHNERIGTDGTHSILDIYRIGTPGDPAEGPGTLYGLTDDEIIRAFGTGRPTREQFETVYSQSAVEEAVPVVRWTGRYTPLYDGGVPMFVAVWGVSGD